MTEAAKSRPSDCVPLACIFTFHTVVEGGKVRQEWRRENGTALTFQEGSHLMRLMASPSAGAHFSTSRMAEPADANSKAGEAVVDFDLQSLRLECLKLAIGDKDLGLTSVVDRARDYVEFAMGAADGEVPNAEGRLADLDAKRNATRRPVFAVGQEGPEFFGIQEWRRVTAADGSTEVRVLQHLTGGISIKLSAGPISMVAAISAGDLAFLLAAPVAQANAA